MQGYRKPNILVSNDDGVGSGNMLALARALSSEGNVFVVAPDCEKSGVSHAFTHVGGLSVFPVAGDFPFRIHAVTGTPADTVKFAIREFYKDIRFDVLFTGLNVGENAGVSSIYSGTVAAAREGALWGVRSIAFSLCVGGEMYLNDALETARSIVRARLYERMRPHTFWNVNFPEGNGEPYRGLRAATMALGMFSDHYDKDGDAWLLDGRKPSDPPEGTDDWCLLHGYAALTPLTLDSTDHSAFSEMQEFVQNFSINKDK